MNITRVFWLNHKMVKRYTGNGRNKYTDGVPDVGEIIFSGEPFLEL